MAQTEQGEMGRGGGAVEDLRVQIFIVNDDEGKCEKTTCKKPNEGWSCGPGVYVDWLQPFNTATDP